MSVRISRPLTALPSNLDLMVNVLAGFPVILGPASYSVHMPQTLLECHSHHEACLSQFDDLPEIRPKSIPWGTSHNVSKNLFPQTATRQDVPDPRSLQWTPQAIAAPNPSSHQLSRLLTLTTQTPPQEGTREDPWAESGGQVFKKMKLVSKSKATFIWGWLNIRRHHRSAEL